MLLFEYEFALSPNPLLYLELPSEFAMNVKTITKFWIYVNNKSLLSTKPLDLISYHILSFAFKFGQLTIAMRFFEFANEFGVVPTIITLRTDCKWICSTCINSAPSCHASESCYCYGGNEVSNVDD